MTRERDIDRERPPELFIEQYLLGELHESRREEVERWLETPEGAEARARIEGSNAALLERLPPARLASEVARRRRLAAPDAAPSLWPRVALAAAAVMLVGLVVALFWGGDAPPPSSEPGGGVARTPTRAQDALALLAPRDGEQEHGTRTKGDARPALRVYLIEDGARDRALSPGDVARAGDRLQLRYIAAGRPAGVILSIDGRGVVTLHYPDPPDGPTSLESPDEIGLPHSYELDDAPAFERFFFITTTRDGPTLDVDPVLRAARTLAASGEARAGTLTLPEGLEQLDVTLLKAP